MAIFRGRVLFRQALQGWSENFWMDRADRGAAVQELRSYVTQRRKSLSSSARVQVVVANNPDPPRDGSVYSYQGDTGKGTYLEPVAGPEAVGAAVNVRFFTAEGKWRNLLFRGLPQDALEFDDGQQVVTTTFADALKHAIDFIVSGPMKIRRLVRGAAPIGRLTSIQTVLGHVTGGGFAVDPGGNLTGSIVELRQAEGISNVNGQYVVSLHAAPFIYFRPRQRVSYGTYTPDSARVFAITPAHDSPTVGQIIGGTTRDTGRPFGVRRGKRLVRRT